MWVVDSSKTIFHCILILSKQWVGVRNKACLQDQLSKCVELLFADFYHYDYLDLGSR